MQTVWFTNKSGDRIILYEGNGLLKVLEPAQRWDRDPDEGTIRTVVLHENQTPPAIIPAPKWIKETNWIYENCPEESIYAPFTKVIFLPENGIELMKRSFWRPPTMDWPVVSFLFKSPKMKLQKIFLDKSLGGSAVSFYNGIPMRVTVNPLSKYAEWNRWNFTDEKEWGEKKRGGSELHKLSDIRVAEEERLKRKTEEMRKQNYG